MTVLRRGETVRRRVHAHTGGFVRSDDGADVTIRVVFALRAARTRPRRTEKNGRRTATAVARD